MDLNLAFPGLSDLEPASEELRATLPTGQHQFAPTSLDEVAAVMRAATDEGAVVVFVGGGTHQQIGHPVAADVVVSTARLDAVEVWEPDDLTVVAQGGVRVEQLESRLATQRQTAGLAEHRGPATVGGAVAAGISGYRRARLGPIRDRLLQVQIVTGDGRIVTGGGRVVKNVSGYDIPRLASGSMGSLGLIGTVCFKLWPMPERQATLHIDDPRAAWRTLYRPMAVLETEVGSAAFVQGTGAEVDQQASLVGAEPVDGLSWPDPPVGAWRWTVRVSPTDVSKVIERLEPDWRWVAQHGVGVVDVASDRPESDGVLDMRGWAESRGGSVVLTGYPGNTPPIHPFGAPPPALDLQRRIMASFDPAGVANRARMMGPA